MKYSLYIFFYCQVNCLTWNLKVNCGQAIVFVMMFCMFHYIVHTAFNIHSILTGRGEGNGEAMKLSCNARHISPRYSLLLHPWSYSRVLSRWTAFWKMTDHHWYLLIPMANVINTILMLQWQWLMWKKAKELLPTLQVKWKF